jgi:hypothetical protein
VRVGVAAEEKQRERSRTLCDRRHVAHRATARRSDRVVQVTARNAKLTGILPVSERLVLGHFRPGG